MQRGRTALNNALLGTLGEQTKPCHRASRILKWDWGKNRANMAICRRIAHETRFHWCCAPFRVSFVIPIRPVGRGLRDRGACAVPLDLVLRTL